MSQSSPSKRHQKSLRTCSLRHSPETPPKAVRVEVSRELSPSLRSLHSSMDLLSLFPAQHLSSLVLEPEPKLGEGRSYSKWMRCRDPATATQQGRYNLLSAAAGSLPLIPDSFHPFAAGLKGAALLGGSVHIKILWSPLTLGGDCFHYHINDDNSSGAANPGAAREGQAEVRAAQLLKPNAAASGQGCSTWSSCSATPPKSHGFNSRAWGHQRGKSKYQGWHILHLQVLGNSWCSLSKPHPR